MQSLREACYRKCLLGAGHSFVVAWVSGACCTPHLGCLLEIVNQGCQSAANGQCYGSGQGPGLGSLPGQLPGLDVSKRSASGSIGPSVAAGGMLVGLKERHLFRQVGDPPRCCHRHRVLGPCAVPGEILASACPASWQSAAFRFLTLATSHL